MLEGAISAAEELRAPIIIGTAEVLLPHGELQLIAPSILHAARRASVPVAVHYDHGLTFDRCIEALKLGFSSIMFDGSLGDVEQNLKETREIVRIAHSMGVAVEGEIGHVGEASNSDNDQEDLYTTPEEAISFVEQTGVDALAISIGTAHGPYESKPKLDIERLKSIRQALDTPLVLHGGSGLSDDDFKQAVAKGISKINIFTDINAAFAQTAAKMYKPGMGQTDLMPAVKQAVKEATMEKIKLFGAAGRY
jgi:fructose-bisphosphate aldolase class II